MSVAILAVRARTTWPHPIEIVAGCVGAAVIEVLAWRTHAGGGSAGNAAILLVVCVSLVWWRLAPFVVATTLWAGAELYSLVNHQTSSDLAMLAALLLVAFGIARLSGRRTAGLGAAALGSAWLAVQELFEGSMSEAVLGLVAGAGCVACGWWGRSVVRARVVLAQALAEKARQLQQDQAVLARAAVADERLRLARELHDVIAHGVSRMGIQAAGAEQVLDRSPQRARASLQAIQDAARRTLTELQTMLEALRADDGEERLPLPRLAELPSLVADARESGNTVDLQIEGNKRVLARGVELTAYRVVQEALTNIGRHAPGAGARVTIRYDVDALAVSVTNGTGNAALPPSGGRNGHGLIGLRERAALYGGTLSAEPTKDGGFVVEARIPLGDGRL
jgi:signal transduction histidine kinase